MPVLPLPEHIRCTHPPASLHRSSSCFLLSSSSVRSHYSSKPSLQQGGVASRQPIVCQGLLLQNPFISATKLPLRERYRHPKYPSMRSFLQVDSSSLLIPLAPHLR